MSEYLPGARSSPAAYYDPGIYDALGRSLAESLEMVSEGHAWEINFLIKMVDLNLDQQLGLSPSHWIWFDAYSATPSDARASREALLEKLLHAIRTLNFHELIEREEDEE